MKRLCLLLCLVAAPCWGQSVTVRNVQVGTHQPASTLTTGWHTLNPLKAVNYQSKRLADIESRMPDGHIYRDADLVTWAHETTHGINSRIRVQQGAGVNALYCLDGNIGIFREPRVTKANVCRYVPANLRGDVWGLYMQGQTEWNDTPLYILDEWVAYINGAYVAVELDSLGSNSSRSTAHDIAKSVEFAGYASALLACIDAHDPNYSDRDKLAQFVAYNLERTLWLSRQSNARPQVEAFAACYVMGGYGECASGNCQSWSWNQGRWCPPKQASRPQPPAKPPTPSSPPPAGAAGCQCKGTNACKCDSSKVAALELRICELEALLKSGKLKGEKGEPGPKGDAGPAGAKGDKGDAAPAVVQSLPVEIVRPNGTRKRVTVPLDSKHVLKLPLNNQ